MSYTCAVVARLTACYVAVNSAAMPALARAASRVLRNRGGAQKCDAMLNSAIRFRPGASPSSRGVASAAARVAYDQLRLLGGEGEVTVDITAHPGVAIVRLSQPRHRNALTPAMMCSVSTVMVLNAHSDAGLCVPLATQRETDE